MPLALLSTVQLLQDLPDAPRDSIGTIVEYLSGHCYLVEILDDTGATSAMVVARRDQIEPASEAIA